MGMMPVHGLLALVLATAFLVWVNEKNGNPAQKFGKIVAWIAVIITGVMFLCHIFFFVKMCQSGECPRMMRGDGMGMGRMMMPDMPKEMPPPPPAPKK